jgi:hypothetical protein
METPAVLEFSAFSAGGLCAYQPEEGALKHVAVFVAAERGHSLFEVVDAYDRCRRTRGRLQEEYPACLFSKYFRGRVAKMESKAQVFGRMIF